MALIADISDIATNPVPFVLRDDKLGRWGGIRFDLDTSLWFVTVKDKDLESEAVKQLGYWAEPSNQLVANQLMAISEPKIIDCGEVARFC
ncbi:MAG: hypothetical protein IT423_09825 [Pirellulaceae bacterium]|nr:hypothetical protein [Pirellulaceae bacterium]